MVSQIVDWDSGNLYPIYPPFPCSESVCGGGGGGVYFVVFRLLNLLAGDLG